MTLPTEEQLQEIVTLVETIPERYRESAFEVLLAFILPSPAPNAEPKRMIAPDQPQVTTQQAPFILPIDVKAFLSQYGLPETVLWKFFLADGTDIRSIYTLATTKKAEAQLQHALMMSLESALKSGQFQVGVESLRTRCTDQKCYDLPNFMRNLKAKEGLFKAIEGVDTLSLSPDGKSELADLLEELSK